MELTLVFLKQLNSKACDDFVGTFADPGSPPSQWDLLKRNKILQNIQLNFTITEYKPDTLSRHFPGFQLVNQNGSLADFPQNREATAESITSWIQSYLEMPEETKPEPQIIPNKREVRSEVEDDDLPPPLIEKAKAISETMDVESIEKVTKIVNSQINKKNPISRLIDDHPWAGYGIGLAFCASVVIGIIGGSYLYDRYNSHKDETEPLLLVNDEGKPIVFGWEETVVENVKTETDYIIENVTARNKMLKVQEETDKLNSGELVELDI
jgi:hypothetical protein